jgi:hypothetical protein
MVQIVLDATDDIRSVAESHGPPMIADAFGPWGIGLRKSALRSLASDSGELLFLS